MYVIAGVSGNTGSVVASTLLAAGARVRVIVRDAAKGERWRAQGADVAIADLDDQAALTRALTGATGAYLLLPPPGWGATGIAAERRAKIAAISGAVAAARPAHVVFLSSIGAELPSGTGPIVHVHHAEHALRDTGVPVTFLRPSYFMENWGGMIPGALGAGALYYGVGDGVAWEQVATADIGKTAAKLLQAGPSGARVVELAGPAPATLADVAARISEAAGKPIQAVSVPPAAMVQALVGMGASTELAESFGELAGAITAGQLRFHGTPVRGTVTLAERIRGLVAGQ